MPDLTTQPIIIIGGGPAGLMAAEVLSQRGLAVELYDGMPSVGRKFLLAGVGGMNVTHSEPYPAFIGRYRERSGEMDALLRRFDAQALCAWIHGLGIDTFVGSSGRVFPTDMKAAPLLRAWLKRLREAGVVFHTRHRWLGWNAEGGLRLRHGDQELNITGRATLLAVGGGSWARLGSDGAWQPWLKERGVPVKPLVPANCGFDVAAWSPFLCDKFAGAPLKNIGMGLADQPSRLGESVLTATGLEGSLVYALSATIRQRIETEGSAHVLIDLLPDKPLAHLIKALEKPRGSRSMAKHLHGQLGLDGVKAGLLRELAPAESYNHARQLAGLIKALPVTLVKARPLDEAISSAGGIPFEALDERLMLKQIPGTFCAGEMLDWEAPTGGYLLNGCFASGRVAAEGILAWLAQESRPSVTSA